jgi:radical SAM protein with 4Fe4S-binding SPASM domain
MNDNKYIIRPSSLSGGLFHRKRPLLNNLNIELSERCNNNCIHCYINLPADDAKAKSRELSTDKWKDILQQAADLGALSVRFSGGEPLLREDFQEIYLHTRHLGLKVVIFTNARLITEGLANLLQKIPPLKKVEVSAYGMHAESYAAVSRSKIAYKEFRNGLDILLERKIPFVVKSVLLPANKDEIDEFEAWLASLPGELYPNYSVYLDLRARRDSSDKNRMIKSLRISPEEGVLLESRDREVFRSNAAQFSTQFMFPQGDKLFACGAGESGCVDAYGNYQMCALLRHPEMVYNLSNGTLHHALTEVFPRFREMRAKNSEYLNRCAKCFLKSLCGQCPAKSWMEHGTLDTPVEYLCKVAHTKARYLGLLSEGEQSWNIIDWRDRLNALVETEKNIGPPSSYTEDNAQDQGTLCD